MASASPAHLSGRWHVLASLLAVSMSSRLQMVCAGAGFMVLAGCATTTLENADGYVAAARRDVPSASAYGDSDLVGAAEKVCAESGATEPGVRLIADQYDEIAPEDRVRLAYLAITVACPG